MIIGVVTTSYPRCPGDPAGHFVAAHVAALRAAGHAVDVIAAGAANERAANGRAASERAASDAIGAHGERITRIASPLFYDGGAPDALERGGHGRGGHGLGGHGLGGHGLDAASFALRLAAQVARRARRWDLAIAHWLAPSALAAMPVRVPLVAIAHGGDVHTLARLRLLGPALALLRLRRARLVFVSGELRALAARHGDVSGAIVQPMGIDAARFFAIERAPDSPPIAAVLARLVPVKGVDVAIAAMAHVRARARLVVAGDGPERDQLARPVRDHVELVGALDLRERDDLLRRASVVVVPSRVLPNGRTEGMPLVALEAMAAGVPVIASAVGGLRELAGPVLVPPDDPRALARAIDEVLASPPPSDRLRAAVAPLDWSIVANRLLA